MKIKSFNMGRNAQTEKRPFLRFTSDHCDLQNCECSPPIYLSVSDGNRGMTITLSPTELSLLSKTLQRPNSHLELFGEKEL